MGSRSRLVNCKLLNSVQFLVWPLDGDEALGRSRSHRGTAARKRQNMYKFGGAAGFSAALAAMTSSSEPEKPKEEISIDELSLYTTPQQIFHYVESEKGTMEQNMATLRKMAEPYITWCQGACGVVKPKVDRTVQFGQDSYEYLRNPPKEFYPRAGVIGFAGILGLFLARGSRMKRLIYPTGLMAVGASMYYPQEAATIAKSTGDAVYDFTLQAYVTLEKLVTGKSAVKLEDKVMKAEKKATSGETKE